VSVCTAKIVKALYDFKPQQEDDLAFRKGDKMKIVVSDNMSVMSYTLCLKKSSHLYTLCNFVKSYREFQGGNFFETQCII